MDYADDERVFAAPRGVGGRDNPRIKSGDGHDDRARRATAMRAD